MTNDQNMIYAYEGEGSDAGSLSSISSNEVDVDLEFDYLNEWGPKFTKLSRLYYLSEEQHMATSHGHGHGPGEYQQRNKAFEYK